MKIDVLGLLAIVLVLVVVGFMFIPPRRDNGTLVEYVGYVNEKVEENGEYKLIIQYGVRGESFLSSQVVTKKEWDETPLGTPMLFREQPDGKYAWQYKFVTPKPETYK